MSTEATDVKHTVPRDAGTWRPIQRIRSGWRVHLDGSNTIPAGWEQVDFIGEAAGIVTLWFVDKTQPAVGAFRGEEVVSLTATEARKHGLGMEG